MNRENRTRVVYSQAMKRQVVKEIESGKMTQAEAMRQYGINGHSTIMKWLRAMGKNHKIGKVIRVETEKEVRQVQELARAKRELESALAESYLRVLSLEKTIEVLNREYGEDVKKKFATVSSKNSSVTRK